jgi:hypothetical protein
VRRGIVTALEGLEAAAALAASAVRHAGWWLEWQARIGPGSGNRELADVNLSPEVRRCESS